MTATMTNEERTALAKKKWYQKCLPKAGYLKPEVKAIFDEAQCVKVEKDIARHDHSKRFKIGDAVDCSPGCVRKRGHYGRVIEIIRVEVWNLMGGDPNKPFYRYDLVVKFMEDGKEIRAGEINFESLRNKLAKLKTQRDEVIARVNRVEEAVKWAEG